MLAGLDLQVSKSGELDMGSAIELKGCCSPNERAGSFVVRGRGGEGRRGEERRGEGEER
jgi:hypothetical protein